MVWIGGWWRRSGLLIGGRGLWRSRFDTLLGSRFWLRVVDMVFETGQRHVDLEHRARNLHMELVRAHRIEDKKTLRVDVQQSHRPIYV
jgi:hypothetical protein